MNVHRFLPRFRTLAFLTCGLGLVLAVYGYGVAGNGSVRLAFLGSGVIGLTLGVAYLLSPTWKLEVVTDDDGIAVRRGDLLRFRIDWEDIAGVISSPSTKTCFVDGGTPETSILIPGIDAPASYALSDKDHLYDTIIGKVPADRVTEVETLHLHLKSKS